jgi:glycosyltransferase involved in cell wall biosynthesis
MSLRYVQVLDALDFGDAVSSQVIRLHQMLLERGENAQIFSKYADHRVEAYRQPFSEFQMDENVILIHHFSGYSELASEIVGLRGYKILAYHNVTPHTFFERGDRLYEFCKKGRSQLQKIVHQYHLALGDSPYNCQEIESLGFKSVKELPIAVPLSQKTFALDPLVADLRGEADKIWLFVSRVAPNKRQDLLVDIFARYVEQHPDQTHHLYLVGRYSEEDAYYNKIASKIQQSGLSDRITLAGKVEDEALPAYYKAADLFLCVSEHEGFCVPIVEAFNYQIPVVAYASTAVETTLGNSPGALDSLNVDHAVDRIHSIFTHTPLEQDLIHHGLRQANRFTLSAVKQRFYSTLDGLKGIDHPDKPLKVSVVICTCNRSDYLLRCLNYLKDQNYPHFEVVVVNGPSEDDTMQILGDRKDVKIAQNPLKNLSISRNLGIEQASGDIVAFIDDDALPYDDWLTKIVERYQKIPPNVVGVGGRTFFANKFVFQFEAGITDLFGTAAHVHYADPRVTDAKFYRYLMGTNSTFFRDALVAVNGFDEQYDYYLDETDLAVRLQQAGGLLANANQAYVRHEFAQSHNRLGKYSFNWRVISKNTVYFGMKNADKTASIFKRIAITAKNILKQRCLEFIRAWYGGDLCLKQALYYCYCAIAGAFRGYYDACFPRKFSRKLSSETLPFLPYLGAVETNSRAKLSSQKMHILIISQEFPPHSFGGIGAYNQTLARELIQLGHEVTVISRGSQNATDVVGPLTHIQVAAVEYANCLPEYPILSKNLAWARKAAKIVEKVHADRPISVIESAVWDFESIGVLACRSQLKVPLIVRLVTPLLVSMKINGWEMNQDLKLCAEMEQELVRHADAVIAISNSVKDSFVSAYSVTPDDRWSVQLLGVQPWPSYTNVTNYGELPKDLQCGEIQILFIGRLESRKGIDVFLKALKIVMPKDARISVWIAGKDIEGWQEKARSLLSHDLQSRVQFLGMVTEERRELLYANCDFVVFPSRYESFGLVALEAMVHKKPVIGARAGAIPEVVTEGESGLLFEPDNPKDLAQKILKLVSDDPMRQRLGAGAKQRVEFLSARNMAKASVKSYAALTDFPVKLKPFTHSAIEQFEKEVVKQEGEHQKMRDYATTHTDAANLSTVAPDWKNLPDLRADWEVTKPKIIGWGVLNSIANRVIVPKAAKFIHSVLYNSMQMQTLINRTLVSENHHLKSELEKSRQSVENKLEQVERRIKDKQDSMDSELLTVKTQLLDLISSVKDEIKDEIKEGIGEVKEDLQGLKRLLDETRIQVILESEVIRSELSYQAKTQTPPSILNPEKLDQNHDLRLNLGCGTKTIEGYINVDERSLPGVDITADIGQLPFEKETVSEIYAAHLVEHMPEYEFKNHVLPYWHELLKENGKLVIICPDAEHMLMEYSKGDFHWEALRKITYGAQDYGGNFHYNMFSPQSLSDIVSSCGFREVTCINARLVNGFYEMELRAIK